MALDSTVGGSAANSYADVAAADAYFVNSYGKTLWAAVSAPNKEILLIEATRLLDTLVKWKGYRSTSIQSLAWPRAWVKDPDGYYGQSEFTDGNLGGPYLPNDEIGPQIKNIQFELAYSILAGGGFQNDENPLSRVKVGPILVDYVATVKSQGFPAIVRDMISKWGQYQVTSSNSIHQVGLVRV
jgi:hypothetical protein